jgi:mycofactocin system FadH/OYE family oxidoreductase 2
MTDQFRYLTSPLKIGNLSLRNRIVFLPHLVQYAENHMPSEREIHYYEERAKGGAALILYGSMTINASSNLCRDCFAFDERVVPGFQAIVERVHKHNAHIFAQIIHYGNQSLPGITLENYDWQPLLAPSAIPDPLMKEMPKEMEEEDFIIIKRGYVDASTNIRKAGFDGIEVNMGHASLLRQFLSPHTNRREDEYGGILENRMRYPLEILKAVRTRLPDEMLIAVRLCMDEFLDDGLSLAEAKEVAKRLETSGLVDFLVADMGIFTSPHIMDPPMAVPLGYAVYASAALKEVVELPVVAFGRITDPYQAEGILKDGHADMIGMARQLISDPEFPKKVEQGRIEDIRTCMGCNQGCFGRCWRNLPITCTQNPAAGREKVLGSGTLKSASRVRKVLIIGGGPAGMKAAEISARRGHRVILYEKSSELGGNVLIFMKSPKRENFGECIRYLKRQIDKLPIEVVLGQEADETTIKTVNPDVVILACGATPEFPSVQGAHQSHVMSVTELLLGNQDTGENVIIYDTEGFWTAANAAQHLLERKIKVRLVTPNPSVGLHIDYPAMFALNLDLFSKGLIAITNQVLKEVGPDYVTTMNIWNNEESKLTDVESVIMATGFKANDVLYQSIKINSREIYRIGDCIAPRRVDNAIWDGEQVGRMI